MNITDRLTIYQMAGSQFFSTEPSGGFSIRTSLGLYGRQVIFSLWSLWVIPNAYDATTNPARVYGSQ